MSQFFPVALRSPVLNKIWFWIVSSVHVLLLIDYQAVGPGGHWSLLFLKLPYLLCILVAGVALVVLPFLLIRSRSRMMVLAWLIAAISYLVLAVGGVYMGGHIRSWGFQRLAARSAPLVTAIHAFTEANGRPPGTLEDLVPVYMPRVPDTEIMAYPRYKYYADTGAARYEGNPWVLVVETPSGGINFDKFLYFPLQNYPSQGYGGSLSRIGEWAYVHE